MVARVKRTEYNKALGDIESLKALAFAVRAKNVNAPSVFKNWTYASLAEAVGCGQTTARKRVKRLVEMGLVENKIVNGRQYLIFKKLRSGKIRARYARWLRYPKNRDVIINGIDVSSLKSIETGLRALVIVEIEKQKDWFKHQPIRKRSERCARLSRWADPRFVDYGIARSTLTRKLHCSETTLSKILRYGAKNNLFSVKRSEVEKLFVGKGMARQAFELCPEAFSGYHYAMSSYVCRRETNRYSIPL